MTRAVRRQIRGAAHSGASIRRVVEKRSLRHLTCALLCCTLLGSAALLQIWVRTRVTEQGYRLSRLAAERQQLLRDHERLQLATARLGSAQRIEDLARVRLGMGPPPPDRVIVLVGGALRSSASMVASK